MVGFRKSPRIWSIPFRVSGKKKRTTNNTYHICPLDPRKLTVDLPPLKNGIITQNKRGHDQSCFQGHGDSMAWLEHQLPAP